MRDGPKPLSVHLGLAATALAQSLGPDIDAENSREFQNMLLGIKAYQAYPYKQEILPLEKIWNKDFVTVNKAPGAQHGENRPVMLLVPSLVNKSYILNLTEKRSMLQYFGQNNIDAYLLDWGDVAAAKSDITVEALVADYLVPAIEYLAGEAGAKIHILGYCMGGTFVAGAAMAAQEFLRTIVFLAAPWDFHAGKGELLRKVKFWAPSAFPLIAEKNMLPDDWTQTLFASMNPELTLRKFSSFAKMDPDSAEAKLFVAVEDWLNDGVDLPKAIGKECITGWFLNNHTGRGKWIINGSPVIPEEISCPTFIVASSRDRLVEQKTSLALHHAIEGSELLDPRCGHIGMIAGQSSVEKVWKPVAEWVHQNA